MENLLELEVRKLKIIETKNIIPYIYTNASGFLWAMCKIDSGTNLGWSDFTGDCEFSGAFTSYEKALEDIVTLIEQCDLKDFEARVPSKYFHWGNYAGFLITHYHNK